MNSAMSVEKWFDDYVDAIYSYIYLLVKDRHLAEELTQETFYKAFLHEAQFNGRSSVKTWLFRIAYTTTMSYFRKKHPITMFFDMQATTDKPLPEDIVIQNEQVKRLYEALYRIKPSYQQVIVLRSIKGFSTKETAHILQWSESKVKMQLSRGLSSMKAILEEGGHDYETFA